MGIEAETWDPIIFIYIFWEININVKNEYFKKRIESISLKITRIYFKFLLRPGGRNLRRNYSTVMKVLGMSC